MSFIYRDLLSPSLAYFAAYSALYKKFDRAWPKTTLDGIPVYSGKLYFYTGSLRNDIVLKRFLVALGMDWDEYLAQTFDSEIESVWFYLKPSYVWDGSTRPPGDLVDGETFEPTSGAVAPTLAQITSTFNTGLIQEETISVTVKYGGDLKKYIEDHALEFQITELGIVLTDGGLNVEQIRTVLHSNPWYYFANARHILYDVDGYPAGDYNGDIDNLLDPTYDLWFRDDMPLTRCSIKTDSLDTSVRKLNYGLFALMGDTSMFDPVLNFEGNPEIFDEKITSASTTDGELIEYEYTLKYVVKRATDTSPVVQECKAYYDFLMLPNTTGDHIVHASEDTAHKRSLQEDLILPLTNSLYYRGYLRVNAASYMKRADFVKMIARTIKIDYSVEEASWWEKAFAVFIIVIAVIVGFMVAGPAGSMTWGSAAAGLAAASVVLIVGMFVLSSIGGLSAQGLVKKIGAFAQIVGIVSLVVGIYAAWQAAAAELGKQALIESGRQAATITSEQIAAEAAKQSAIDIALQMVKTAMSGLTNAIDLFSGGASEMTKQQVASAVLNTVETARAGFDLYAAKETEEMQSELNDAQAELDALNKEQDLQRRTADPLMVLIEGTESVTTYDALTYMEIDWKLNFSPDADKDAFFAERSMC